MNPVTRVLDMDINMFNGGLLNALDKVGAISVVLLVALAVITDKLVWHTRLKNAEKRADRWEEIALDALTTGARAGVVAAEVAAEVVTALPDRSKPGKV